ncbi:MAG: 50S ribosomal protein L30 [Oscillospiraceae bacterium]|nr:50S ribosomal protein L30 [Oscillospiraceae bacterium]MDD4367765.1 50S ribosomal protein L30 [Oscillospiraceae bacterium]
MSKIKVTLVKSISNVTARQKATAVALGVTKIGHSALHEDNEAIRGMIRKLDHVVKCEEA